MYYLLYFLQPFFEYFKIYIRFFYKSGGINGFLLLYIDIILPLLTYPATFRHGGH